MKSSQKTILIVEDESSMRKILSKKFKREGFATIEAKDGKEGFKENVELVRSLREELPDANLMFDNHSIRYYDDVNYSIELCKAISVYNPFWVEEPICPEHLEGYKRIKGETGVTIAGGEHLYTKWPVKAFLDNKCLDMFNQTQSGVAEYQNG